MGAHLFSDLGLRLSIVPFGGTDRKDVADLAHELELLGTTVNVLQPVGLPGNAYNPRRRQYRAEALLTLVGIPGNDRVLAITHEDL